MKEIILDLRSLVENRELADDPAHTTLEELMIDYAGKVIRIKITVVAPKN